MRKTIFTLFVAAATLLSCSSDDSPSNPPANDGVLLKKVIDTFEGGFVVTTELTYDGNKLTQISTDDGSTDTFVYTNGLLTQQTHTWEGSSSVRTFEYDANNRLIKRYHDGILAYTFTYNQDGTISKTESSGNSVNILTFENGNLISDAYTNNAGTDYVVSYTYDTKNNPFKNIHQKDVFALLGYYNANNVLASAASGTGVDNYDNSTTTYSSYNSNSFPVESSRVAAQGTIDEEITASQFFYE